MMTKYAKREFVLMLALGFAGFLAKWAAIIGLAWIIYNHFIK
jgi:hypothetical protein